MVVDGDGGRGGTATCWGYSGDFGAFGGMMCCWGKKKRQKTFDFLVGFIAGCRGEKGQGNFFPSGVIE